MTALATGHDRGTCRSMPSAARYRQSSTPPWAVSYTHLAERVNGTDAVIVRYAAAYDNLAITAHDTANTRFTTNVAAHGIPVGELVLVCNYSQAAIMSVSAADLAVGTFTHAASAAIAGNCSAGLGLSNPTDCTPPVSYTHLDVYKRQAQGCLTPPESGGDAGAPM